MIRPCFDIMCFPKPCIIYIYPTIYASLVVIGVCEPCYWLRVHACSFVYLSLYYKLQHLLPYRLSFASVKSQGFGTFHSYMKCPCVCHLPHSLSSLRPICPSICIVVAGGCRILLVQECPRIPHKDMHIVQWLSVIIIC